MNHAAAPGQSDCDFVPVAGQAAAEESSRENKGETQSRDTKHRDPSVSSVSKSESKGPEERDDDGENTMGTLFGRDAVRIDSQKRQRDRRGKAVNEACD